MKCKNCGKDFDETYWNRITELNKDLCSMDCKMTAGRLLH